MKKYFLLSIAAILFAFGSFSQASDLPTLESLKKQLANLKDTDLVNCLNLIAYNIYNTAFGPSPADFIRKSDSISLYANLAFEAAKKINYRKGMVDALNQQASGENIKGFGLRMAQKSDSTTTVASRNYLLSAIAIAKEINDDDALGEAYYRWPSETGEDTTDYMKKSLPYFEKAGNEKMEGVVCTWIAEDYLYKGYYENAFEYCQRGLILNHKTVNDARTKEELKWREYLYQQSLADMASLYKEAGDYQSSLEYLNEGSQFGIALNTWDMGEEKAEIFRFTGEYDSSFYYLRKQNLEDNFIKKDIGATFLMAKQYDSALILLNQVLPEFRKTNRTNGVFLGPILFYIGSAYAGKNDYATALTYAREGLANALKREGRPDMMNGYELLSRIHHQLGNNDSAYHYLLKYNTIKDSIQSRQFLFRINNYKKAAVDIKKEAQLSILDKDNKLKTAQLKQEAQFKNFLMFGLIGLLLIGFFIFRWLSLKRKNEKLKNEKIQTELHQRAAELEMQALRAQMNPHFIFNCLSSINRFILKNEGKTASNYLVRFSRLIRMVLINSQKSLVTLEDELQMLTLYLDMERLRFKDSFDYGITFLNTVETGNILIPPLLLQPFCENAIWHGLMHKEGHGRLDIQFSMKDNILNCTIADNGIGLERSEEMKSKSAEKDKSMGLKITTERLALLNGEKGLNSFYDIESLRDEIGNAAGTKVTLKISFKGSVEETV